VAGRRERQGGAFTDVVSFAWPSPWQFFPWFRIFGWSAGVCANFTAAGR
jgi:hypothetical protein